ncbi:phospholipase A1 1 [Vespa mandarinia]|uniref:phospholipase A1 1 n=1 Tax=Vespa mandarinia TaxID=7446 RepID=UPI00160DD3BC|nr:phospholipase A1 1 isoform X3 [Vespa mandarinia]XP_035732026.1 phospholipase A1 1 [Vespa mandarinia]
MNLKYLLFFCLVQTLHYCYAYGDPSSSNELDRFNPCPYSDDTVKMIVLTRENKKHDFYTLDTIKKHNEFKKSTIKHQVAFITHGFTSSPTAENFLAMAEALLNKGNYLVILIDWRVAACTNEIAGVKLAYYNYAASNTRLVGNYIATVTKMLIQQYHVPMANIRLIGHSLGAHTSGFAGKKVQELGLGKYSEIIGLDPAGPSFKSEACSQRICETDANYVQIIHTSNHLGTLITLGTVDFYMNNGKNQPGCGLPIVGETCSHTRAVKYFTECIKHECCLIGVPQSKNPQPVSKCTRNECVCVGLNAKTYPKTGSFYVPVESKAPYCNNKGKKI